MSLSTADSQAFLEEESEYIYICETLLYFK